MVLVKRDYCLMFAKEDCRRQRACEPSISSCILAMQTTEAQEFGKIITQRAPKNGPSGYLRTSEAWLRRASAVRLCVLESVKGLVIDDANAIDVSDLRKPTDCDIVLTAGASESAGAIECDAKSQISIAIKQLDVGARMVSHSAERVKARKENVLEGKSIEPKYTGSRKVDQIDIADGRSQVSVAPRAPAACDARSQVSDAHTSICEETHTPVGTLSRDVVQTIMEKEEDTIRQWYDASLSALQSKQTKGEMREEQFKRKKALLRAEYWQKMDKIRNNATPTVIDA